MWNSDPVVNLVQLNKDVRFGCDGLHAALLHSATGVENKLILKHLTSVLRFFLLQKGFILMLTVKLEPYKKISNFWYENKRRTYRFD